MNADGSNRLTVVLGGRSVLGPTPAWSPDGTQLAYFGAERTLTIVNLDGTVHTLSEPLPQWVGWWDTYPVAWGEDGIVFANHVSVDDTHTDLFMVQPDGSGLVNLTKTSDREEVNPGWLPDGSLGFVAYGQYRDPQELIIAELNETREAIVESSELPLRGSLANDDVFLPNELKWVEWAKYSPAFSYTDGDSIWVVDLTTPSAHPAATPSDGGTFRQGSFSPDDTELVFWGNDSSKGNKGGIYKAPSVGSGTPVSLGTGARASWWGGTSQ